MHPTMRRLGRYILYGLAGLSVALALVAVGLWVWSDQRQFVFRRLTPRPGNGWGDPPPHQYYTAVELTRGAVIVDRGEVNMNRKWSAYLGEWSAQSDGDAYAVETIPPAQVPGDWLTSFIWKRTPDGGQFAGTSWGSSQGMLSRGTYLSVPITYAAIPGTTALCWWAWHLTRGPAKRHRRRALGHCPACGYDLRATPARCPECGAAPSPPPPVAQA